MSRFKYTQKETIVVLVFLCFSVGIIRVLDSTIIYSDCTYFNFIMDSKCYSGLSCKPNQHL